MPSMLVALFLLVSMWCPGGVEAATIVVESGGSIKLHGDGSSCNCDELSSRLQAIEDALERRGISLGDVASPVSPPPPPPPLPPLPPFPVSPSPAIPDTGPFQCYFAFADPSNVGLNTARADLHSTECALSNALLNAGVTTIAEKPAVRGRMTMTVGPASPIYTFTMCAWYYMNNWNSGGRLIDFQGGDGTVGSDWPVPTYPYASFYYAAGPGRLFCKGCAGTGTAFFYLQPTTADTTNWHVADWPTYSWHHFCTVSDVAATSSTLYVDGQVAYSGTPISSHNKFTILGWHGEWAAHNMDGYISEVAWTQAALSAEEIANVYNRGAA